MTRSNADYESERALPPSGRRAWLKLSSEQKVASDGRREDAIIAAERALTPCPPQRPATERALLVLADAEDGSSKSLTCGLTAAGWRVEIATSLSQLCFHVERATSPFGIVFELSPNGVPQYDVLRTLRGAAASSRIVIVTAYPSAYTAIAAIRFGADEYVSKPIGPGELIVALEGGDAARLECEPLPSLQRNEWEYINRVLWIVDGNISAAARVLGVERSTLQRKLKKRPPGR